MLFSLDWVDLGNSCADVLAGRAAAWVTPTKEDAEALTLLEAQACII